MAKFIKNVSVRNPQTGKSRVFEAGEDVPEWAADAMSAGVLRIATDADVADDEDPGEGDGDGEGSGDESEDSGDDAEVEVPDPGKMTVTEIEAWAKANPDHMTAMLKAETAGKARVSAIAALTA